MKRTSTKNFILALLAGTAFAFSPAIAQNDNAKKPAQAMEGGAAAEAGASATMKGDKPDASSNSAAEYAPGQKAKSGEVDSAAEAAPGQMKKSGEVDSAAEAAPGQMKKDVSDETTASIDITADQETELRSVWTEIDTDPVAVDFDVTIGAAVPNTVTLQPLPPRVVEIVPAYETYQYFVLEDGRIAIVEPATLEIVYIVRA
jgi:hypothetical protein